MLTRITEENGTIYVEEIDATASAGTVLSFVGHDDWTILNYLDQVWSAPPEGSWSHYPIVRI